MQSATFGCFHCKQFRNCFFEASQKELRISLPNGELFVQRVHEENCIGRPTDRKKPKRFVRNKNAEKQR